MSRFYGWGPAEAMALTGSECLDWVADSIRIAERQRVEAKRAKSRG